MRQGGEIGGRQTQDYEIIDFKASLFLILPLVREYAAAAFSGSRIRAGA